MRTTIGVCITEEPTSTFRGKSSAYKAFQYVEDEEGEILLLDAAKLK